MTTADDTSVVTNATEAAPEAKTHQRLSRTFLLLVPFAFGFFFSHFFRVLNSVLSPRLEQDLGMDSSIVGWLSAAYFLGFAAFQAPLGLLLDRYGPARVQAVLSIVTAAAAFLFALSQTTFWLTVARGMIGLGVSGSLMAAFMVISYSCALERRAMVNSCFLIFGGLGAFMATGPLNALLDVLHWREMFKAAGLALAALAVAFYLGKNAVGHIMPNIKAGNVERWPAQLNGLRYVFSTKPFWRISLLAATTLGTLWSFQGLWTALWLRDVVGYDAGHVVSVISGMAICALLGNICIGIAAHVLGRRGVSLSRIMVSGCSGLCLVQLLLVAWPTFIPMQLWFTFSFLNGFPTLAYALLPQRYPQAMTGRVLVAINILALLFAFVLQAVFGTVVEMWRTQAGLSLSDAYRVTLTCLLFIQAAALLHCIRRPTES